MGEHGSQAHDAGPLAGLRVVDCSTILAGPYCTMLLGDLGADVIKVEPPAGDGTRGWGPPWVGSDEDGTRTAAYYLAVNRNKRSIRLDLRAEAGQTILRRLLERADVFVENFRPGTLERLGLDDAALAGLNSRLVHLGISGFGTLGPGAGRPGYDLIVQAAGGLMSITGAPDQDGDGPTKVGVAVSDVASGLFGTVAVLAALLGGAREPDERPEGPRPAERVDVTLLGSTLALLVNQAQNAFATRRSPDRTGNAHPNIVPYQVFATADGSIAVAVGSERQWASLCAALGRPDLAADPRFAKNGDRVEHRRELVPVLAELFSAGSTDSWLARLEAADVPCAPINDVIAAFEDPAARALGMRATIAHPRLGDVDQVGSPFRLSGRPMAIRTPPPLLGEHTDEVLAELGYDPEAVAGLRAAGVI